MKFTPVENIKQLFNMNAGGATARGHPSTQYRLRVKRQKDLRYLKACEVANIRAAIQRGRRLKQLEREQLDACQLKDQSIKFDTHQ